MLIVGLTSPQATLVELECTKPCADQSGKSLRELLQRVMVDEHVLRLMIVSFLVFRSRAFFALFSATILSESRASIFEFRRWFSETRSYSFSPKEFRRVASDSPIELSSLAEQFPKEPNFTSSSALLSSMRGLRGEFGEP